MDAETVNIPDSRSEVAFEAGTLTYKLIGERVPDGEPVTIVLPGHGGGIASHGRLAEAIHDRLHQQAIVTNLAQLKHPADLSRSVLDQEAVGLIELLKNEGLTQAPINFVAHSMGALVIERAAKLAKSMGLDCFDYEKGSRTIFIAPAGTSERENPASLLLRVVASFRNNSPKRAELTADVPASTGEPGASSKVKDLRLLGELGTQHLDYPALNELGLKPAIIFYPDDRVFPWSQIARNPKHIEMLMESADGLMEPSGTLDKPSSSAFHPAKADHYSVNYNVGPTADSIVDYFTRSRAHPNAL